MADREKRVAFERGQVVLATLSVMVGGILGWIVPLAFSSPQNLGLWLISVASILVVAAGAAGLGFNNMLKDTSDSALKTITQTISELRLNSQQDLAKMLDLNREIQRLTEECVRRQAELIPRDEIYRFMANCFREAKSEVTLITYLMVDPKTRERTFLPNVDNTPNRAEFYEAVYEAIKNRAIQYVRVWMVPHDQIAEAREIIASDEYQKKECELIDQISKTRPDRARLIITDHLTTASFILIDRKHLFLNIDFYDSETKMWHSPYMLFVKDATGDSFKEFQSIIVRLTERV